MSYKESVMKMIKKKQVINNSIEFGTKIAKPFL